ncbi:MAG: (2Fe-2S)-binding protein [Bdellovibrio sp.]|nr:(2Fe-2S)-binding protein [Bdellovibrio sp.]
MPTVSLVSSKKDPAEDPIQCTIDKGQTIYDGFIQHGHELPHGCLAGSCGSCKVEIISGMENLKPPGVIESDTIKSILGTCKKRPLNPIRLACRAKVLGDVTLQVFECP